MSEPPAAPSPQTDAPRRLARVHGCLLPEPSPRSLDNLSQSPQPGRALASALACLAFLEREGWPRTPAPEGWVLDGSGLSRLLPDSPEAPSPEAALGGLLEAFGRALSPSRHRGRGTGHGRLPGMRETVRAWLSSAAREPLPGPGDLLSRLQEEVPEAPFSSLPPEYCVGWVWQLEGPAPGLHRWRAPCGSHRLDALRVALCGSGELGLRWLAVDLAPAPPYPFAGLEPLVRALLPPGEDPGRWIAVGLSGPEGGETALAARLADLVVRCAPSGILAGPAESLDPSSLRVLETVCARAAAPVVLTGEAGTPAPLTLLSLRFPGIPPLAEAWFAEHLEALAGSDPESWIPSLDLLGAGLPRSGASLLPPCPPGVGHPASANLGRGAPLGPATGPRRRTRPPPGGGCPERSPALAAREGAVAELAVRAARLGDAPEGRLWSGTAHLLVGQPALSLALWEGLEGQAGVGAASLRLLRARAHEGLGEFSRALAELERIRPRDLPEEERPLREVYRGHLLDLTGKLGESRALLTGVLERCTGEGLRAQTLCYLAELALHSEGPEEALGHLAEAESLLPRAGIPPLVRFLVHHRTGMALKRSGEYARALGRLREAVATASAHGFRRLEAGALCDLGNCLRMVGEIEEAEAAYRSAREGALGLGNAVLADAARFDRAICQLEKGRVREALAVFEGFASHPTPSPVESGIHAYWVALAHLRLGDLPASLEWSERGLRRLEEVSDPEVRLPLMLLRAEALLGSGQSRKAGLLLGQIRASLGPSSEADDVLHACSLHLLAGGAAEGGPEEWEERAAGAVAAASPEARSQWGLALARSRPSRREALLREALADARGAPGPHALCAVLAEMAGEGQVPPLTQAERARVRTYLETNRVAGRLRDLLPLVAPTASPSPGSPREVEAAGWAAALEAWAAGSDGALEEARRLLSAEALCAGRGEGTPRWAGSEERDLRRGLLALRGRAGAREVLGRAAACAAGPGGGWCAAALAAGGSWGGEALAALGLLARLCPEEEAPPRAPRARPAFHPAVVAALGSEEASMGPVLEVLSRAAFFRYPVLLTGEPGVGKDLCARALHAAWGPRKPLVPFNCANLTPTLASSQLFGHRRGSFTGADRDQEGLVEAARGGILFLDEVGELPPETQAQLLRFLQDGSYLPLGEVRSRTSDARVVAATNRDLPSMVRAGSFRPDLYHRLNVISIEVPPLRARRGDIVPLFRRFFAKEAEESGAREPAVGDAILSRLESYAWPGNVRELQNTARAVLVASHGEAAVRTEHLPEPLRTAAGPRAQGPGATLSERVASAERTAIEEALLACGGSLTRAAKALGISRQGLSQKVRRLGLRPP